MSVALGLLNDVRPGLATCYAIEHLWHLIMSSVAIVPSYQALRYYRFLSATTYSSDKTTYIVVTPRNWWAFHYPQPVDEVGGV